MEVLDLFTRDFFNPLYEVSSSGSWDDTKTLRIVLGFFVILGFFSLGIVTFVLYRTRHFRRRAPKEDSLDTLPDAGEVEPLMNNSFVADKPNTSNSGGTWISMFTGFICTAYTLRIIQTINEYMPITKSLATSTFFSVMISRFSCVGTALLGCSYLLVFCSWIDSIRGFVKRLDERYKTHGLMDIPISQRQMQIQTKEEYKWRTYGRKFSIGFVIFYTIVQASLAVVVIVGFSRGYNESYLITHHYYYCALISHYFTFSIYSLLIIIYCICLVAVIKTYHKEKIRRDDRRFFFAIIGVFVVLIITTTTKVLFIEVFEGAALRDNSSQFEDTNIYHPFFYNVVLEIFPTSLVVVLSFASLHKIGS